MMGYRANDFSHYGITAVGVTILFTGPEIERPLLTEEFDDMFLGDHIFQSGARNNHKLPLIPDAAGMVQKVSDRDFCMHIGEPGQVFPNVVIKL